MENAQNKYLFVTIKKNSFADLDEFVEVWSKAFNYPNMDSYTSNISKEIIELSDLRKLFVWKNGMPLSERKSISFEVKILSKLSVINQLKAVWESQMFNKEFEEISTVWKIFLLHIIRPEDYPIFDQHVYRAYKYIVDQTENAELPYYDKTKFKIYNDKYLPFYLKCKAQMSNRFASKSLDEALWTFGKFLNEYPKLVH